MNDECFEREMRYQTMMAVCLSLRRQGVLSERDFAAAETLLNDKYHPILRIS